MASTDRRRCCDAGQDIYLTEYALINPSTANIQSHTLEMTYLPAVSEDIVIPPPSQVPSIPGVAWLARGNDSLHGFPPRLHVAVSSVGGSGSDRLSIMLEGSWLSELVSGAQAEGFNSRIGKRLYLET
jgi:hypothetical protein